MAEPLLPASALRDESVYRTYQGRPGPVHGCGFMLKPTARGGYANRVLASTMVVVYVLRGEGTFTDWNAAECRLAPGDMVILPAGKRHGIQQDPDGRWAEAYVTFDGGFGDHLHRLNVLDPAASVLRPGVDQSLVDRFDRILADLQILPDHALPSALLSVHGLIEAANLLNRKRSTPDRQQQMVDAACALLSQDLQARVDIEAIAAQLEIGYERFRKIFRQRIGISPGDYRIRRRIDRARALIWQHRLANKEVAYLLGYPDPFTFSKQFRKVTGQWPDDYRKSLSSGLPH